MGETFSEFHSDDQEGRERNGVGDVAEIVELCVSDTLGPFNESVGEGLMGR